MEANTANFSEEQREFLDNDLGDRSNRIFNLWMEFLEIRKKASESDDEYIRCFNLIISEIGEEGKDIEKMMLLVLYNGLDPAMRIKMREQPEFPKTQQNLRVL
ncbi:MAG: hypothetical protein MMC33_010488, partial [Icmadophila ericetorum]|nr:hypothetical protein [Icmadophila ericetorum]